MNIEDQLVDKNDKNQKDNDMKFLEKFIKQKEQQNIILEKMLRSYKPSEEEKSK